MNYINLIGINLFIYIYLIFNSYIALSIFLNGILYHCLTYKFLYFNDIIFNIYYIIYGLIYSQYNKKYLIAIFIFSIHILKKYKSNIKQNSTYDQILHVCCIQFPAFISLYYMQKLQ